MNDTTWFWQIVDARGLADVSSDEFVALNELISKAERAESAERARDEALSALREKEEALSKAQRTIGHRDRRIARLWAAIEDARAKGYRLPVEEEPPVVLSSAERPCPHAPTYDAGLCCGHPDDCTFIAPVSREQRGEEA